MKRYISAVLAAVLISGLSACGGGGQQASSTSESATPSPTKTARPVPDVIGVNFQDARRTLIDEDFVSVQILAKDGKEWTGTFPDKTVLVTSTDPAAGVITDTALIKVTVGVTEAEVADAAKKAAAQAAEAAATAKLAARYTFDCSGSYGFTEGAPGVYKSLKEVWASPEYKDKNSGTCHIEVDGGDAYDATPLLPSEQSVAKVVAQHGGGTYGSPAGDFGTALELCAKPASDYADQVSGVPGATRADAYGALALCPDAPHAGLLRQVATTVKIQDGTYTVGKDLAAGTYRTKPGAKDCYWARSNGGGDIIDNGFVGFAPNGVTVTVYPGEGFESNNCPVWTKIG